MADDEPAPRFRFGIFEADASTGELRRQGVRVRLNAQPFQVLCLLLHRPGELLTREAICRALWPEGTFVDYEHGVNSAINRIREALGDTAASPRYIETLARRGYRFVAPVEQIPAPRPEPGPSTLPSEPASGEKNLFAGPSAADALGADFTNADAPRRDATAKRRRAILASPEHLARIAPAKAHTLFVLFQIMYLGFYIGALANLPEIQELLSALSYPPAIFVVVIATAAILIPARTYMLTAVLLRAPGVRPRILALWPYLLALDELWALSPFLLLHHINFGVALACTALLVCAPFAQRSLVLMGAAATPDRPAEST